MARTTTVACFRFVLHLVLSLFWGVLLRCAYRRFRFPIFLYTSDEYCVCHVTGGYAILPTSNYFDCLLRACVERPATITSGQRYPILRPRRTTFVGRVLRRQIGVRVWYQHYRGRVTPPRYFYPYMASECHTGVGWLRVTSSLLPGRRHRTLYDGYHVPVDQYGAGHYEAVLQRPQYWLAMWIRCTKGVNFYPVRETVGEAGRKCVGIFYLLGDPRCLYTVFDGGVRVMAPHFFGVLFFVVYVVKGGASIRRTGDAGHVDERGGLFHFLVNRDCFQPVGRQHQGGSRLVIPRISRRFFIYPSMSFHRKFVGVLLGRFRHYQHHTGLYFQVPLYRFRREAKVVELRIVCSSVVRQTIVGWFFRVPRRWVAHYVVCHVGGANLFVVGGV